MANIRDPLSPDNRAQFRTLVCEGLGYCCPYALFRVSRNSALIAARLGVTHRCVNIHKARFDDKTYVCEENKDCLRSILIRIGK